MGGSIHGRRRNGEWRYKIWSSVVDAYTTEEMNETELRAELMRDFSPREIEYGVPEKNIPDRLAPVHENGTSERSALPIDIDGPWHTERCNGCGGFHHAFKERAGGKCRSCGEASSERWHGPECGQ